MLSLARLPRVATVQALVVLSSIVLCVVAALLYESRKPILYEAVARVSISQSEAKSSAEADAVTARAKALATSRTIVEQAIAASKVPRDVDTVETMTTVVRLGTSPVVEIGVRDRDSQVAAVLANGISYAVVKYLSDSARADLPALLTRLSHQIDLLNSQYQKLVRGGASPEQIAAVVQQRSNLEQQLLSVEAADAQRTRPSVVDQALVPTKPLASPRTQEAALAGLLGLVLGIGIVAAAAALRPMATRPAVMAEVLGAPSLGALKLRREQPDSADEATVARLVARARRLDADTVMLTGARPELDTERLATAVGDAVAARLWHRKQRASAEQLSAQGLRLEQPLTFVGSSPDTIANSAWDDKQVVVIGFVPRAVSRSSLLHIRDLADSCGWPLAGFVTYSRHRSRRDHRGTSHRSQKLETRRETASDVDAELDAEVAQLARWADLEIVHDAQARIESSAVARHDRGTR
jgi:capsular polysaccharide biosynthesis protein